MDDWRRVSVVIWGRGLATDRINGWGLPVALATVYLDCWYPGGSTVKLTSDVCCKFVVGSYHCYTTKCWVDTLLLLNGWALMLRLKEDRRTYGRQVWLVVLIKMCNSVVSSDGVMDGEVFMDILGIYGVLSLVAQDYDSE